MNLLQVFDCLTKNTVKKPLTIHYDCKGFSSNELHLIYKKSFPNDCRIVQKGRCRLLEAQALMLPPSERTSEVLPKPFVVSRSRKPAVAFKITEILEYVDLTNQPNDVIRELVESPAMPSVMSIAKGSSASASYYSQSVHQKTTKDVNYQLLNSKERLDNSTIGTNQSQEPVNSKERADKSTFATSQFLSSVKDKKRPEVASSAEERDIQPSADEKSSPVNITMPSTEKLNTTEMSGTVKRGSVHSVALFM
ncbi:hypothetical protein QR680_014148 [Steinernema hermaphroditum]|uniref:Uncharacterized protein n=1 Tax=Steinernema hermaphroditum TaxID=289476 RepID=A0AA39IA56_9BILA|nr:hypothetical protein QR680_014148 [Steinernema hermaphroditum]